METKSAVPVSKAPESTKKAGQGRGPPSETSQPKAPPTVTSPESKGQPLSLHNLESSTNADHALQASNRLAISLGKFASVTCVWISEALGLPVVHIDILNVVMLYNAHDNVDEWEARPELDQEIEQMAKFVVDGDFRQILAQGRLASDAISLELKKKYPNAKDDRNSVLCFDKKHHHAHYTA